MSDIDPYPLPTIVDDCEVCPPIAPDLLDAWEHLQAQQSLDMLDYFSCVTPEGHDFLHSDPCPEAIVSQVASEPVPVGHGEPVLAFTGVEHVVLVVSALGVVVIGLILRWFARM